MASTLEFSDEWGNTNGIAQFEKISREEWLKSMPSAFERTDTDDEKVSAKKRELRVQYANSYDDIKLPTRATTGSAGYDFFLPFNDLVLLPGTDCIIPTGIKCRMKPGWFLALYPRSGHGFKYKVCLANTVGVIDSDYYNCEKNEGHIIVKLCNRMDLEGVPLKQVPDITRGACKLVIDTNSEEFKNRCLSVKVGGAFCQGIFQMYGITVDDSTDGQRIGGIGSTSTESN